MMYNNSFFFSSVKILILSKFFVELLHFSKIVEVWRALAYLLLSLPLAYESHLPQIIISPMLYV